MAFFGRKKETTQQKTRNERLVDADPAVALQRDLSAVLLRPRVTEKASRQNDQGVYTFVTRRDATKYDVRDAVEALFKVIPRKVTMVHRAPRASHSRARGRKVIVSGLKKANVFLKKGDRIDSL